MSSHLCEVARWRLQEVTAPNQEIVQHIIPPKPGVYCFSTLVFARINQMKYKVFMSEL